MKIFILVLLCTFLSANEMQRIESVVEEIANLRVAYEKSQRELKEKDLKIKKLEEILAQKDDGVFVEFAQPDLEDENMQHFKAKAFRFDVEANVYDSINGDIIDRWDAKTSFTSNQKTDRWVKITGYFVDKKWQKAKKDMWVESDKVFQR